MAVIITLPTAAESPVFNPRRRGRLPRGVYPLWYAHRIRAKNSELRNAAEKAMEEVTAWSRIASFAQSKHDAAQIKAHLLSKQRGVAP